MDDYTIIPYEAVGAIRFKDTTEDVVIACGTPKSTSSARNGDLIHHYNWGIVRYYSETTKIREVTLLANARPIINGIDLLNDPEALPKIMKYEKQSFEFIGFLFMLDHGISLSGFHKKETERVVAAFSRGATDHLKHKFIRYEISE